MHLTVDCGHDIFASVPSTHTRNLTSKTELYRCCKETSNRIVCGLSLIFVIGGDLHIGIYCSCKPVLTLVIRRNIKVKFMYSTTTSSACAAQCSQYISRCI